MDPIDFIKDLIGKDELVADETFVEALTGHIDTMKGGYQKNIDEMEAKITSLEAQIKGYQDAAYNSAMTRPVQSDEQADDSDNDVFFSRR